MMPKTRASVANDGLLPQLDHPPQQQVNTSASSFVEQHAGQKIYSLPPLQVVQPLADHGPPVLGALLVPAPSQFLRRQILLEGQVPKADLSGRRFLDDAAPQTFEAEPVPRPADSFLGKWRFTRAEPPPPRPRNRTPPPWTPSAAHHSEGKRRKCFSGKLVGEACLFPLRCPRRDQPANHGAVKPRPTSGRSPSFQWTTQRQVSITGLAANRRIAGGEDGLDNPVALFPCRALWSLANRKVVQRRHPAFDKLPHFLLCRIPR